MGLSTRRTTSAMPEPSAVDAQVAAAQDRRRHEVPAQRVGADGLEDLFGVGVVAQPLGELAAVVVEHDAVADARS